MYNAYSVVKTINLIEEGMQKTVKKRFLVD